MFDNILHFRRNIHCKVTEPMKKIIHFENLYALKKKQTNKRK